MKYAYRSMARIMAIALIVVSLCSCAQNSGESGGEENPSRETIATETAVAETVAEETVADETVPPTQDATEPAPIEAMDFTVYDLEGNPHNLSDFFGKPVVLNFWASWCGPCRGEMQDFQSVYEEMGDEVQFLMVNMTDGETETVESATSFIEQQSYTFPVFFDTDFSAAITYGVSSIPMTIFIDAEGHMTAYASGAINAELLKKGIDMIYTGE